MDGYTYTIDGFRYRRRDGRPAGLAEVWAEVNGVGHAAICRPDGSLMLAAAGNQSTRADVRKWRVSGQLSLIHI